MMDLPRLLQEVVDVKLKRAAVYAGPAAAFAGPHQR